MMITFFKDFLVPGTLGVAVPFAVPLKLSLMISQITWIYIYYSTSLFFFLNILLQAGCHMESITIFFFLMVGAANNFTNGSLWQEWISLACF
jgi:hypothetical protein